MPKTSHKQRVLRARALAELDGDLSPEAAAVRVVVLMKAIAKSDRYWARLDPSGTNKYNPNCKGKKQ